MSRRAYVFWWLFGTAATAAALGGWIHGIFWVGGIKHGFNGPVCSATTICVPMQFWGIDLAPIWAVGTLAVLLVLLDFLTRLADHYAKLPTSAQLRAKRSLEREDRERARIAQLEAEAATLEAEIERLRTERREAEA